MSQSLDASSPEGRETWMSLGRLLRAEGITPAMIKQNRDVLITAMKTTLQRDEPSNTPQSYYTACESLSSHHRTFTDPGSSRSFAQASLSILGSAPPRGPTFTDDFLKRKSGAARSLDQDANVQDGLQSLLQGMDNYQCGTNPENLNEHDEVDLGGMNANYGTTDYSHDSMAAEVLEQRSEHQRLERENSERDRSERGIQERILKRDRLRVNNLVQRREYDFI